MKTCRLLAIVCVLTCTPVLAAGSHLLWELGRPDSNDGLALAPKSYEEFQVDGFFVVGQSDARKDWPYVHPGPLDTWAGGREHTFTIHFGVQQAVAAGNCRLIFDLLDTHYKSPPLLRLEINGHKFEQQLPVGASDNSIRGQPAKGKPYRFAIEFPSTHLKPGNNQLAITTATGSWFLYGRVALETPAAVKPATVADADKLSRPKPSAASNVKQVIVVFKTHFDIGYTDMASNIVTKYRTTMIDQALAVVDQNRDLPRDQQFAWTIPGWPMHQILDWPAQTPERKQRVEQAFKDGRFVVHALPFTTHTELLELEDLVRSLDYSTRLARRVGLPLPRDGKMTDVPEHSWALATILGHAGVTFMHIGCNAMSGSPQVPPLYWWEGPDGSRVLTMYSPNYGTGLLPPKDWPYQTWLALLHTGDNHGPPRPDEVKKVLAQLAAKLPDAKVRIGRLSDFGDAILAEKPDLPVVRADTPDTWIHGPMSDPAGAKIARNTRPLIATTEILNTELRGWGVAVPDAAPAVATAYEQSLLYGEHTWGGSIGWLKGKFGFGDDFKRERASGRFARIESSWDEHTAYIEKTRDLITPVLQTNLDALARAVGGKRIVVFNPLPWKRDGVVRVGDKEFVARDVPASGYRAFRELEPAGDSLENEFYKVTREPAGGAIRSLVDKRTGRELVEPGFGRYLYERFDNSQINQYVKDYLKNPIWKLDFEKPGLPPATLYQAVWPTNYTLRVTAPRGLPYVELEITIRDKPLEPAPEAGWLCLPFKADAPQFRLGRLGSIIDPSRDLVPGANRNLFAINTGVAAGGVAFCPLDHPLVSLGEPGCWKFSRDYVPKKSVAYVNLFNNQWNTNFRLWNSGTWSSRVRIWAGTDIVVPSLEARYPLMAALTDGPDGKLPATQAGVSVSRRGVLVTAYTPMLLRVWEQTGVTGEVVVTGLKAATATPVNLRGEKTGTPVRIKDGKLTFNLGAFAPASFVLEGQME